MNTLVFDIQGSFAHFRKFYANSSSLSYEFPPRTVLCGILAGIIGLERDSYYEAFSEDQVFIALQIRTPTKRISQNVNYYWVKSTQDLNGSGGRMQIPLEWVVNGSGVGRGHLSYRVYVHHRDRSIHEQLASYIRSNHSRFPISLGITEALGSMHYVEDVQCVAVSNSSDVEIATVSPIHFLEDITYADYDEFKRLYMRDRIPCAFDTDRMLSAVTQVVYEPQGHGIMAKPKSVVFRVAVEGYDYFILPMQSENGRSWGYV